jgi:hypothetical protein
MSDRKIVIAYYDFDYVEDASRFSETEFNDLKDKDYMMFQIYTCQDYEVQPLFYYDELLNFSEFIEGDDVEYALSDAISTLTGCRVDYIEIKD